MPVCLPRQPKKCSFLSPKTLHMQKWVNCSCGIAARTDRLSDRVMSSRSSNRFVRGSLQCYKQNVDERPLLVTLHIAPPTVVDADHRGEYTQIFGLTTTGPEKYELVKKTQFLPTLPAFGSPVRSDPILEFHEDVLYRKT